MRNLQFRLLLSVVTLVSILTISLPAAAAPVKFEQVRQIINAKPGKAGTAAFAQLRLAGDDAKTDDDKDDKDKGSAPPAQPQTQDDRVITTTTTEIVQDEVCDCVQEEIITKGFPKFALLGLAAIPLLFLIPRGRRTQTTPTRTTETQTPTPTTETPTPQTPTPIPPEPVPEPMTILLFGTGLASIGMAARKRLGKKDKEKGEQ